MKKFSLFILSCALVLPLSVHAQSIKDGVGRKVGLESNKNIVAVPVVVPAMLYAVSNDDKNMVGMHPMSKNAVKNSILKKMAPGLMQTQTSFIKGGFEINIEEVLKLKPSMVIQVPAMQKDIKSLARVNVPVVITPKTSAGMLEYFKNLVMLMGRISQNEDRAKFIYNDFLQTHKYIAKKTKNIKNKPKGLVLFNVEQLSATGSGSFGDFWLNSTGAINVARDIKTSVRGASVSMEQIMAWNPEVIYLTNFSEYMPEDLYKNRVPNQDWSKISAVKNKRVHKIPLGLYRWYPPSADAALMLKWMSSKNNPKTIKYDMPKEIVKHFKNMYKYDISPAEVKAVLNPKPTGNFQ